MGILWSALIAINTLRPQQKASNCHYLNQGWSSSLAYLCPPTTTCYISKAAYHMNANLQSHMSVITWSIITGYCMECDQYKSKVQVMIWTPKLHPMYRPRGRALGFYSLSGRTFYRKISWRLEAARLYVEMTVWLWILTGISEALLWRCLSNFRAIEKV